MSETKNSVAAQAKTNIGTELSIATNKYMQVIKNQMYEGGAEFDEYSGKCVIAAMGAINNMVHNQGYSINDLNTSNINEILIKVATLKLNANAVPQECYFQVRNVNIAKKGQKANWERQVEFGIMSDGNDAILARYGRDVKKVHQFWKVRSGDKFVYPKYNGLQMTAPQWEPTGQGDVVRVVYPIVKTDNTVEYYISERRDVVKNLYAHISNNLMNETFGIAENRYDATKEQKNKIESKKKEIMDKAKTLGELDAILDCEELAPYISPAWKDPQSREEMIIRKMRNNVVKKIPKDFKSALAAEQYNLMDDTYREVHAEIEDFANSQVFDTSFSDAEPETEPVKEEQNQTESEPAKTTESTTEPNTEEDGLPSEFPM